MTDGILLAETQGDPWLREYDTIIVDEAHERSLNIDFLLGYLKRLLVRRQDLRVVITSATIDSARFAAHFGEPGRPAPVIEVSGRLFPVEVRWRPPIAPGERRQPTPVEAPARSGSGLVAAPDAMELPEAIAQAIDEVWRERAGDVLVFLPGEREIRELEVHLRRHPPGPPAQRAGLEILPLYSRLAAHDQLKVFDAGASSGRRIVLATNVAETSVTVPGIRYVIDPGLARVKRYRYRGKVEQLQIEPVSRAAANQRAGRCGRVADGVCVRLYDAEDFERRSPFTDPEILRSSLAGVILRMLALGLVQSVEAIGEFPFLDVPPRRAIVDGQALLVELGALDEAGVLTPLGTTLARLPLDPRIARMLLAANDHGALQETLIVASALSVQDPRERPLEAAQAADEAHKAFVDERSDFLSWVKLWDWLQGLPTARRKRDEQLRARFLNPRRVREWTDVHQQLAGAVQELGWTVNQQPATYPALHESLLTGLLGNVGNKALDEAHYQGTHAVRFWPHPASGIKKGSKWLMAAELVDTTRLYARTLARIEPEWIERLAGHLLKKQWGEPHWEKRPAQIMAHERATLYGLVVYAGRKVSYVKRDPKLARELLIREGLVAGDWDSNLPFLRHNRRLVGELEQLEHRMRRPDLLVDEHRLFAFYDARIPAEVVSGSSLESWWRQAVRADPNCLLLNRAVLLRQEAGDAVGAATDDARFPRELAMRGGRFALSYLFEPGNARDGVTLTVPLAMLAQVDADLTDWLVPGLLRDKVLALLKSLPPKIRHRCQPLSECAEAFVAQVDPDNDSGRGSLSTSLAQWIGEHIGLRPRVEDFRLETIPDYLQMHYVLVDDHARTLASGRSLAQLRAEHGREAQTALRGAFSASSSSAQTSWTFGALPEILEIERAGQKLVGFPGLVDAAEGVTLEVFEDPETARRAHAQGCTRLASLALREPLKALEKSVPDFVRLTAAWALFGSADELRSELRVGAIARTVLLDALPMDETAFTDAIAQARQRIGLVGQAFARELATILLEHQAVLRKLPTVRANPSLAADLERQLSELLPKRWPTQTPPERLGHLARYLKAIALRLDKWRADPQRDAAKSAELAPLLHNLRRAQVARRGVPDPRLEEFRWLLEELRVSLFAQELRAAVPVSVKRLQKIWESIGA